MNLDDFLALPWSDSVRDKLRVIAATYEIRHLVAVRKSDGSMSAMMFKDTPVEWPDNTVAVWTKPKPVVPEKEDRTWAAVALVDGGLSPYQAAQQVGLNHAAVYRALRARKERGVCPCCKQLLPVKGPAAG